MVKEKLVELGLSEEQATAVLKEIGNTHVTLARFNEVNEAKKQLEGDLKDRDKQLAELSKNNKDNTDLQSQIQLLQEANKLATENYDKELARIKLDSALDMALTGAKGKNPKAIKALLDMDKIKLDEEGLKGLEDQLASLKTNESYLFETESKIEQPPMQGFQPTAGNAEPQGAKPQTLQGVLSKLYSGGTN